MSAFPENSRPRLSAVRAWTFLGINLLATPGLGSLWGGRKLAGQGQLLFSVTGFCLIVAWIFKITIGSMTAQLSGTESAPVSAGWWQAGALLFGVAWLWSLATSISLVREAWPDTAVPPPRLSTVAPPRLADLQPRPAGVRLTGEKVAGAFLTVSAWRRQGEAITRTFQFPDFPAAMAFVNQVAALAEAAAHHPDIDIRWNKVTLVLTTHDAGGLTEKDFSLARQIDQVRV